MCSSKAVFAARRAGSFVRVPASVGAVLHPANGTSLLFERGTSKQALMRSGFCPCPDRIGCYVYDSSASPSQLTATDATTARATLPMRGHWRCAWFSREPPASARKRRVRHLFLFSFSFLLSFFLWPYHQPPTVVYSPPQSQLRTCPSLREQPRRARTSQRCTMRTWSSSKNGLPATHARARHPLLSS